MTIALTAAWILPLLTGTCVWLAVNPEREPGWRASALGYGCVLGMVIAAGATALCARADTAHAWLRAAPVLVVLVLACGALAWRRMRALPARATLPSPRRANGWMNILLALLLCSLAWRGWLALREILLRPTYPWDAWDAWAVKSKTWVLLGHYVPFVSMPEWLAHPTRELYTSLAWAYPPTLPWIQVWFASAAGGWIEPLVNLPWFALWLAMLAAHYGQWRALGLSRRQALVGVYALGSLPLITVHVALAGYADLWVATILGFAVLAWLRFLQTRAPRHLAIAACCAVLLPLLKLEGAIWLLLFAAVAGYGLLRRRWRRRALMLVAALFVFILVFGRLKIPAPGLGWVEIGRKAIDIPGFGRLAIAWHGAALSGIFTSLFVQPNWHLLWWLAPPIVFWRWRALFASAALRRLGALLLIAFASLFFLFVLTDAATWAEHYTAVNRLVMHLVPALVTLLLLLLREVDWREVLRDTPARLVRRSQPA
jgi:hypothetical protein